MKAKTQAAAPKEWVEVKIKTHDGDSYKYRVNGQPDSAFLVGMARGLSMLRQKAELEEKTEVMLLSEAAQASIRLIDPHCYLVLLDQEAALWLKNRGGQLRTPSSQPKRVDDALDVMGQVRKRLEAINAAGKKG